MTQSASEPRGDDELSGEQQAALAPHIRLIEAGPGAGKTKTVVARLRARASAGHRVALLSFTNAAVDVARRRCRDVPGLLEPPNFIGTFDVFFHRFVVTPAVRREAGKAPTYLASWDDLPEELAFVRPDGGGQGIRLRNFKQQPTGSWMIDEPNLKGLQREQWERLYESTRQSLNEKGDRRIRGLLKSHVYDTDAARRRALELLRDPDQKTLTRIATRFGEVIVDEFQDCDQTEHRLLGQLFNAGIHVVVVADPDQAIYEFRQQTPHLYADFRARRQPAEIAPLTTCFRSTPVICKLTSDLRTIGLGSIEAHEGHPGGPEEIHVVVGTGVKAGAAALGITRRFGVPANQTRVLAHQRSHARSLARAGNQPPQSTSQMMRLLGPMADLHSFCDARNRLNLIRQVEDFFLDQIDWSASEASTPEGPSSREEQLTLLGTDSQHLRVAVRALVSASLTWDDTAACTNGVHAALTEFAEPLRLGLIAHVRRRLTVRDNVWKFWISRTTGLLLDATEGAVRWGHIHGVKGMEYDAVILALPATSRADTHVLDDWASDTNSEQRRVLYVGVSRARRVLVFVVPPRRREQLEALLSRAEVPFVVTVAR